MMLVLAGCSDDAPESTGQTRSHELRMSLGTHPYSITREAGDMPTGFELYNHETAPAKIMQIQGYMTFWDTDGSKWDVVPTAFTHEETEAPSHIWTSKVALKTLGESASYYFYGYLPKESVTGSVTIAPKGDEAQANGYAKGAVMTFNNLDAILPKDICVIVGAQGYGATGHTEVPDMSSRLGVFSYNPDTEGDNIFLLVEHLYAGMTFNFRLDETYSHLRQIKVKKVRLIPAGNSVVNRVNIKVNIVANSEGKDPISTDAGGSVVYTPQSTTSATPVTIFDDEQQLTTTYQPVFGYICPADDTIEGNKTFTLETTYDVYDTDDILIREGETARNAITLTGDVVAGRMRIVNITVQPTYLYVLSNPDLDNPTFQISSE